MSLALRPYQRQAIDAVMAAYARGVRRQLVVKPTGAGKTVAFAHLLRERGGRGLVLAHRDELVSQAVDKLHMVAPELTVGVCKAERDETGAQILVASVQTLARPARLARLRAAIHAPQLFGGASGLRTLVVDECHHFCAGDEGNTFGRVLEGLGAFDDEGGPLVVGFTATPDPLTKSEAGELAGGWQEVVFSLGILDGIREGWLVDVRAKEIKLAGADFRALHSTRGEIQADEAAAMLLEADAPGHAARAYLEHAAGRRALVFTPTIAVAHAMARAFVAAGVAAEAVDGEMPLDQRRAVLRRLHTGETLVVPNAQVLTEGFDEPAVSAIVMARPTRSRPFALQCLDDRTQVLTRRGFVGRLELLSDDHVAGFDTVTGRVAWSGIKSHVDRPVGDGEQMVSLESDCADFRVTGRHRMVARRRVRPGRSAAWSVICAEDLAGWRDLFDLPVAGDENVVGARLSDDEIRFLGWVLTDGTIGRANGKPASIAITQAAHQPYHEAIRACLEGCGFKYSISVVRGDTNLQAGSDRIVYRVSFGAPRATKKHLSGWARLLPYADRALSLEMERLDRRQLGVLLETLHMGDGNKQRGQSWTQRTYHLHTSNRVFAERLQSLCVRRGFRCNLSERPITGLRKKTPFVLHIKDAAVRSVGGSSSTDRPKLQVSAPQAGERVWCVETELGTLITRRNGKVVVMGNCIGRGLRPFPGKSECVVLDLVGSVRRHDLMTVSAMFGVRDDVVAERGLLEACAEEARAGAAVAQAQEAKGQLVARDLELFRARAFAWVSSGDRFVLSMGDKGFVALEANPERPELFDVVRVQTVRVGVRRFGGREVPQYREQRERLHVGLDSGYATGAAEDYVRRSGAMALVSRDAAWRQRPASAKQAELLLKWGLWREGVTAGEASDAIGARMARRRKSA